MIQDIGNTVIKDDADNYNRAFFECIEKGDCVAVETFFSDGIEPDIRNSIGWTALMVAVAFGKPRIVQLLLDKGAEVNAQSFSGLTAFRMASYAKHDEIIQMLKNAGAQES